MADIKTTLDNIVAHWELEETSGTRVDSHSTNDLTDNNTVTSATGIQGTGADFEATNSESLSIADNTALSFTSDFSVSFWVKYETVHGGVECIFGKSGSSGSFSYWMETSSHPTERVRFFTSSTGSNLVQVDWNVTLSTGTWYHMVFAYDASAGQVEWYKDGSSQGTRTGLHTSLYDNTTDFRLGATEVDGSVSRFFDGVLDEVTVTSDVITSSEVTTIYNSGSGIPYETVTKPRSAMFF